MTTPQYTLTLTEKELLLLRVSAAREYSACKLTAESYPYRSTEAYKNRTIADTYKGICDKLKDIYAAQH